MNPVNRWVDRDGNGENKSFQQKKIESNLKKNWKKLYLANSFEKINQAKPKKITSNQTKYTSLIVFLCVCMNH